MRKRLAWLLVAMLAGYLASPYVVLWHLDRALQSGDDAYVSRHVAWRAVRAGMIADVGEAIRNGVAPRQNPHDLPPFGASFVQGMAGHLVDSNLQQDHVMAALHRVAGPEGAAAGAVRWAFFDGPVSFHAVVAMPNGAPVRLEMRLVGGRWRIVRADMPPTLLAALPQT